MWHPVSNLEELHKKAYEELDTEDNFDLGEDEQPEEKENDFNLYLLQKFRGMNR